MAKTTVLVIHFTVKATCVLHRCLMQCVSLKTTNCDYCFQSMMQWKEVKLPETNVTTKFCHN